MRLAARNRARFQSDPQSAASPYFPGSGDGLQMAGEAWTLTDGGQAEVAVRRRLREAASFVVLAIVVCPIVTVAVVGAYGFAFWTYFRLTGLPGPW